MGKKIIAKMIFDVSKYKEIMKREITKEEIEWQLKIQSEQLPPGIMTYEVYEEN